ncbi:hypothetical protein ABTX85_14285, partial [Streptomyces sp. NPDC096097]|uniref:hypothetical protein n=1 Tax=Streptomyces sp. NPDC096097 TaxID=3155546 RepID=UPI00331D7428
KTLLGKISERKNLLLVAHTPTCLPAAVGRGHSGGSPQDERATEAEQHNHGRAARAEESLRVGRGPSEAQPKPRPKPNPSPAGV